MVTCAVRFMPTVRIHWCSYSREHCSMKANNVIHGGPTMFPVPSKLSGTFYLHKSSHFSTKKRGRMRCSLEGTLTPLEKEGIVSINAAEDLVSVTRFRMSDFELFNHVSIGLAGKGDEVIYEAIVKDCHSPLYNSKVVLRKLISSQAQRRGKRAIEVLKRLARRQLMYHSYAMQVHGYLFPHDGSFTLVHGYHGSYSLRHWLQLSDWLPTLEATLALDEESVRRVGDDTIGGPAVSRQLRIIRLLMRDLLIGVNYLHSHGLAHTELRLENVHISPVDRHIKVGILGKAADFCDNNPNVADSNTDRKQLMIAFDMRCVGFMMAKMVLRELMDPITFSMFKNFLNKGNDASCLREWFLPILSKNSPNGNSGLQMLDRNSGAGWHLLSLLLATKPSERISCLDALRHPFLCGPRWRVPPSMDIIRWGLGSTIVRITEEYIYGQDQRGKLAHFIELMEMLNPRQKEKNWLNFLPGKWRLLYSTGKHIGLTLRQPSPRVLIRNTQLTVTRSSDSDVSLSLASYIGFLAMLDPQWPHNKSGMSGHLQITTSITFSPATRQYQKEETAIKFDGQKWKRTTLIEDFPPPSLPILRLNCKEFEIQMNLDTSSEDAPKIIREVRTQIPPEIFDVSKLICATYVDSRFLVLRGVNGSALIFTRSCANE